MAGLPQSYYTCRIDPLVMANKRYAFTLNLTLTLCISLNIIVCTLQC